MDNLLPIGSVVLLKSGEKKIMIYGRMQMALDSNDQYDYVACLYPEGNISEEYTYLFNHSDINEVIFKGYADEDEEAFKQLLITATNEMSTSENR